MAFFLSPTKSPVTHSWIRLRVDGRHLIQQNNPTTRIFYKIRSAHAFIYIGAQIQIKIHTHIHTNPQTHPRPFPCSHPRCAIHWHTSITFVQHRRPFLTFSLEQIQIARWSGVRRALSTCSRDCVVSIRFNCTDYRSVCVRNRRALEKWVRRLWWIELEHSNHKQTVCFAWQTTIEWNDMREEIRELVFVVIRTPKRWHMAYQRYRYIVSFRINLSNTLITNVYNI